MPEIPQCFGAAAGGMKDRNNSWKSEFTYQFLILLQKLGALEDQDSSLHMVGTGYPITRQEHCCLFSSPGVRGTPDVQVFAAQTLIRHADDQSTATDLLCPMLRGEWSFLLLAAPGGLGSPVLPSGMKHPKGNLSVEGIQEERLTHTQLAQGTSLTTARHLAVKMAISD